MRYVADTGDASKLRGTLNAELWSLLDEARQAQSYDACVKIVELIAKVNGALINKHEVTHKHDPIALLSEAEKRFFLMFNCLPAEAYKKLGHPVPENCPSLEAPPTEVYQPVVAYLEATVEDDDNRRE
jgi:hypothetical protein